MTVWQSLTITPTTSPVQNLPGTKSPKMSLISHDRLAESDDYRPQSLRYKISPDKISPVHSLPGQNIPTHNLLGTKSPKMSLISHDLLAEPDN